MIKVTLAEFQEELEKYQKKAYEEAVRISDHDLQDLILISAEEYRRLRQLDQQAFYPHELSKDVLDEMGE